MRYAVWYIILFFSIEKNYGQNFPNIQFTHLAEKEGLSNNQVNCIAQDNNGFIWIGTNDGLNRFDGYRVRTFHQIPGVQNSLIFNGVYNIVCDHKNGLWICTSEGISYYKEQTGRFYNFRHNPSDTSSIENDEYANVYLSGDNAALITNTSNLYRFDSLLRYKKIQPAVKLMLDRKQIVSYANLIQDRQKQPWGIASNAIFLLDEHTMQEKKRFQISSGTIRTIYQDSRLQYWVGSFGGGLQLFKPVQGTFQQVPLANKSGVVYSITEWKDKQGYSWIVAATDGGLILVDPVTLKSKAYLYHPGFMEPYSLSGNNISSVFVDAQNILWIGTDNGVSYVRPSLQQFELWDINTSSDLNQPADADYIYSCDENKYGIWFSTWLKKGIFLFNETRELPLQFSLRKKGDSKLPNLDSLKPYYVLCQGDSIVWFTTENSLVKLNLMVSALNLYNALGGDFSVGLRTIIPKNDHEWWIRTRNNGANGLYIFDPVEKKFIRHYECDPDKKGSAPMFIMNIFLSNKKELFLGSRNQGLYRYDSITDGFVHLFQFTGKQLHSHSNNFEYITEDKKGLLWIGTFKGLFAFDPATAKIVYDYSEDPFIGGVEISALAFDEQQNLWMNSDRGIFCLTTSGIIKHFSSADGLPNNFDVGVLQANKDGYMYSGFRNYFVRFRPDELVKPQSPFTEVHFSEASVMDKPYFFQYNSSGEKEMVIPAGYNRFALDFSIMNYDNNNENHYYYRLDGAMNSWQQNENGHLVFYNISPGNYTLHVKGTVKQPPSPSEEDIVHITVKAFWWQTAAFWIACGAIIILLSIFLIRRNIANIRKRAAFKQRLTEMEMTALRAQMNPHFIFNSLNSIENFIMQNKERQASDYLNKFARLIRIILENSFHDLITVSQDLEALQLYVDLEQFRFHNKFSYQVCIDKELTEDNYRIPPLLIQPFVENAIVHGLANSDQQNLRLAIAVQLEGDYIKYTIEDNGVGRKKAALYRLQNKSKYKSVGLHITRERINIFNSRHSSSDDVMITDLYDEHGNAAGTHCDIKIKPV